jgi:hypothetical protein
VCDKGVALIIEYVRGANICEMVRCGLISCRTGLKCPCTRKPDENSVALNLHSSAANGSCIRTKETYFSALPIDIEIFKLSFDWA